MKLLFNKSYFITFSILLLLEVIIALFLQSGFVRETFGDFLVVILLYCLLKSFWQTKVLTVALVTLCIAFIIEFLQLTHFLEYVHLESNGLAKLVLGSTFHLQDLVAYILGIVSILIVELKLKNL